MVVVSHAIAKLIVSVALTAVAVRYMRRFVALIPFLPWTGLWATSLGVGPEWSFLQSTLELFLLGAFFREWMKEQKDRISIALLLLSLASLPSLANAGANFGISLFLVLLMSLSVGLYGYFLKAMGETLRHRLMDTTVLIWVVLGVFIKVYDAVRLGGSALYERSGSIWGSNHVAMILFLLMPFVTRTPVLVIACLYLLATFSRGVYILLPLYLLALLFVARRRAPMVVVPSVVAIVLLVLVLNGGFREKAVAYFDERFSSRAALEEQTFLTGFGQRLVEDERWTISRHGWEMARSTNFMGIGLGGFRWGLERLGYPPDFSNAHNLYVTVLAEGGLFFCLAVMGFLAFLLHEAYALDRAVFVGVASFVIYGFFGGQLYEAAGLVTAGDYYVLLFVLAYLVFRRRGGPRDALSVPKALRAG